MTIFAKGDLLAKRYEVRDLRMGGMGVVYYCIDMQEHTPIALKTYQDKYLDDWSARDAFINECKIWIGIGKKTNVVRALRLETFFEKPYVCIELVPSTSGSPDLRTRMQKQITKQTALRIAIDVCQGMEQALESYPGLTHRDLKPENILITPEDRAKITDFGLSTAKAASRDFMTDDYDSPGLGLDGKLHSVRGHQIAGTPPYMAPEQWTGESIDTRADIYAFGCILFELITGQRAFNASGLNPYKQAHFTHHPENEMDWIDPGLLVIVSGCLRKNREERFSSFTAVREMLNVLCEREFGSSSIPAMTEESSSLQELLDYGKACLLMHEHRPALSFSQRALQIDPMSWKAWNNIGTAWFNLGDSTKGLEALQRSLEICPGNANALNNLGIHYLVNGDEQKAFQCFEESHKADPTLAAPLINKAVQYRTLNDIPAFNSMLDQALHLEPYDPIALRLKFQNWEVLGLGPREITDTYFCILRSEFDPYERFGNLLYAFTKGFDASHIRELISFLERGFEQIAQFSDEGWEQLFLRFDNRGIFQPSVGNHIGISEDALASLASTQGRKNFLKLWVRIQMASLLHKASMRADAFHWLDLAKDEFIPSGPAGDWNELLAFGYAIFATNAYENSDPQTAMDYYRLSAGLLKDRSYMDGLIFVCLYTLQEYNAALEHCEKYLSNGGLRTPNLWCVKGDCLVQTGNIPQAGFCYHKALELDPAYQRATRSLQDLSR